MKKIIFVLLIDIFLFKGFAQTGFSEEQVITTNVINPNKAVCFDINGDGFKDLIVASKGDDSVSWYENLDGLGNFGDKNSITNNLPSADFVNASDIDNDGDIDILALSPSSNQIVWFENLDGNGTFSNKNIINNTQDAPKTVIGSDIDGDGDKDILACSRLDNTIAWYENVGGQGNFSGMNIISTIAETAIGMDVADIDGDGDIDVISDSASNQNPAWFRNMNGEGTFGGEHIITSENSGTMFVLATDLDGDNDNDIVSVEFGGNTIAWFENLNGFGTFGPKQIISNPELPIMVDSGDIDNDGDIDIVSVSIGDGKLAWYKNDGLGNFDTQITISNPINPRSCYIADIDNDGYKDIVTVDIETYRVSWYKNLTYLGIEDQPLQALSLYPNPATNALQINNPNNVVIKQVKMYNLLGKEVIQVQGNSKTINVSNLQSGVYFVKLIAQEGVRSFKVVKE